MEEVLLQDRFDLLDRAPLLQAQRQLSDDWPTRAMLAGVDTSNGDQGRKKAFAAGVVEVNSTDFDSELEDEPPSVVTFSPDYDALSPLWPSSDTTDAMVPKVLLVKLIAWQNEFDSNFGWQMGWISEEAKAKWAKSAVELEAELRDALAGKAELVVDLWPLKAGEEDTGVDRPE